MASFFGEMATSVGGAFTEHAEDVREERLQGEDAQRDMQLTKMRMAHETTLTQKRIDADDTLAQRRMDYDTLTREQEQTFTAEESVLEREAGVSKYEYEGNVDMVVAALRTFTQEQKDGTASGGGWKTFTEQSYDMETGQPTTSLFAVREGITWKQIGDKFVQAGDPNKIPYDFGGDIELQRKAEAALWAGELTAQEFDDTYDYVPAAYITGQVVGGNNKARKYLENLGISIPRGAAGGGGFKLPSMAPSMSKDIQILLDDSAARFGLPAELLLAVMDVESLGEDDRATATSSAGARGYMQIMPATFEEIGREIFGPDVKLDITNPAHNIPIGAAYLAKMNERYKGNIAYALAAYNAGPTRVDRAIKVGGQGWINELPPETRSYLPKALGRYFSLLNQADEGGGVISEGAAAVAEAVPGAEEAAPAAEPIDEQIVEIPAEDQLPPAPEVEEAAGLPPRTEALRGTSLSARQARGERRDLMKELSDEDVDRLVDSIVSGMAGEGGDLFMLKGEQSRRKREKTIDMFDLLLGTEKGVKFREENLARFRADDARRKAEREAEAETETQ